MTFPEEVVEPWPRVSPGFDTIREAYEWLPVVEGEK